MVQKLAAIRENPGIQVDSGGNLVVSRENGRSVVFSGCCKSDSIRKLSVSGHLKDSDVVIVYGFGIGDHILDLIQATSPKTFILVIDPSLEIFKHALDLNDLRSIFETKRLSLSIGEDPYQATRIRLEKYFGVFTLKNIKVFPCPPSVELSPDYFAKVESYLKEVINVAENNRTTLTRFSGTWQSNILENLPYILGSPGISQIAGKFAGKPAIIISAGPSLDKNVKWLASAKGKAVLICVDTALKTLLRNGITPDFLIALDALQLNYMHVAGERTEDICLVANPITFPQILKKHKGRILMMTFTDPMMVWIEKSIGEKGNAVTGGSVATAAFDFACKIGAAPVLLVGQDLAYTGNRAYTINSFFCEEWLDKVDDVSSLDDFQKIKINLEPDVRGKGWDGRDIPTTSKMLSWKRWFEVMVSQGGVSCIHATEGGVKIEGTEIKLLREAINLHCKDGFQVEGVLGDVDFFLDTDSITDLLQRMKSLGKKVGKVGKVCQEGVSLATGLLIRTRKQGPDRNQLQKGMARLGNIASNILSEEEFLELNKWTIDMLIEKMQAYKANYKGTPIQASLASYNILLGGIGELCSSLGGKLRMSISMLENLIGEKERMNS